MESLHYIKDEIKRDKNQSISIYKQDYSVLNFRNDTVPENIYWTTIRKEIKSRKSIVETYKVSYSNNNVFFEKDGVLIKNSNSEYKILVKNFLSDVLIFKESQEKILEEFKTGTVITLKLGDTIRLKEGLSLSLTNFISKHVFYGQPSYARAELNLIKENKNIEFSLSNQFLDGINYPGDTWTSDESNNYFFRVLNFKYDDSLEILITKK